MLEILSVPSGFTMEAELRIKLDTYVASIVLYTVKLLVFMEFEAVISIVLIPGSVIGSEKRKS